MSEQEYQAEISRLQAECKRANESLDAVIQENMALAKKHTDALADAEQKHAKELEKQAKQLNAQHDLAVKKLLEEPAEARALREKHAAEAKEIAERHAAERKALKEQLAK